MNQDATAGGPGAAELLAELLVLRAAIIKDAEKTMVRFGDGTAPGIVNLAHYLSLRNHDVRVLQRHLMWRGLSSLGRLESRVLPAIDAVLSSLAIVAGRESEFPAPTEADFFAGESRLIEATNALFGEPPTHRRSRIMVTLPSQAVSEPELVLDLAQRGMDIARVNCAHDNSESWRRMSDHLRKAGERVGRRILLLMDIAGPKIRTGSVLAPERTSRLHAGDLLRLVAQGKPRAGEHIQFSATVSLPQMVGRLVVGHRLRYDDGKLEGIVERVSDGEAVVRVTRTKAGGAKLKEEKGINLPDTALGLSPLTAKDRNDISVVIELADIIGYSFVSRADDLDLLEGVLAEHGHEDKPLGLVAKIETPEALRNLPDMIARASGKRPFGVMIARGDLAAEIGFERLAEMQEEILWICEAAGIPTIWATQVLEGLVTTGVPSRGEMTDAAMAARAECVMLNKGPNVGEAIEVLDRLLARMDGHIHKKTPILRALKSW